MSFGYRKVYSRIWRDQAVRSLSPIGKLVAVYLICGQSNRLGIFPLSEGQACEDLGLDPGTFRERFDEVLKTLAWQYDEDARVLFIHSWWRYQAPANPNVLIGSLRDLEEVPQTSLQQAFFENIDTLNSSALQQVLRERSGNVAGTFSERYGNKEKEKKKEKKKKNEKANIRDAPAALREQFEQEFWNPYPTRNGRKLGKDLAFTKWIRLSEADKALIAIAVKNLAADVSKHKTLVRDAHRFIGNGKDEPWREWIEPATTGGIHENLRTKNYRDGL